MDIIKRFPFEYKALLRYEDCKKSPFIDTVEKVLQSNIQGNYSFGCRISHCHTHAGSRAHFENFVEAELLFHNSYYNRGFAVLTYESIINQRFNHNVINNSIKNIVLVGYESYSELYLVETIRLLNDKLNKKDKKEEIKCRYLVYETVVEVKDKKRISTSRLRNLHGEKGEKYVSYSYPSIHKAIDGIQFKEKDILIEDLLYNTLFVLVVPINTTLTTMDKMYAKLQNELCIQNEKFSDNCEFISLITLGGGLSNEYWESNKFHDVLKVNSESLTALPQYLSVRNYAYIEHEWLKRNKCYLCYPDQDGGNDSSLLKEEPMFETIKGSVVPMVRFGVLNNVAPFDLKIDKAQKRGEQEINLQRVWNLTEYMVNKHIIRGSNHFQVYFDTVAYFNRYKEEIEGALRKFRDYKLRDSNALNYDYIVAPRHVTNAGFVNAVNNSVFGGMARIIYFDADKEYRSNLVAKYSDLKNSVENIIKNHRNCIIRLHFVDDIIHSGATYIRVKSLIESILRGAKEWLNMNGNYRHEIKLFDTIFLLINRVSDDTLKSYLGDFGDEWNKHKFTYTNLHISPMRTHNDACTLCRLVYDYENIMDRCATNGLADRCLKHISDHEPKDIYTFLSSNSSKEHVSLVDLNHRLEIFLAHLLEARLNNEWHIGEEDVIDCECDNADKKIKDVFCRYFHIIEKNDNSAKIMKSFFMDDSGKKRIDKFTSRDFIVEYKSAFIKVISRPFFIYHIRRRQASFLFCLEQLERIIKLNKIDDDNLKLCKELVKALVNLKANYLVRMKVLSQLEKLVPEKSGIYNKKELLFQIKGLTELADSQKSKLLESWLIEGKETLFFKELHDGLNQFDNYFVKDAKTETKDHFQVMSHYGKLYLENNGIFISGLLNQSGHLRSYFMSDFNEMCEYNHYRPTQEFLNSYSAVKEWLLGSRKRSGSQVEGSDEQSSELDIRLRGLLKKLFDENALPQSSIDVINDNKVDIISFVYNEEEKNNVNRRLDKGNDLFKFALLSKANDDISKRQKQKFFHDYHIKKLVDIFERSNLINEEDILFFRDSTLIMGGRNKEINAKKKSTQCALIKFRSPKNNEESFTDDDSIYLEIRNFQMADLCHWFALKIILTLRQFFVKYIKKANIKNVKDERIADMRRKALSSSAAGLHVTADQFHFKNLYISKELKCDMASDIICKSYLREYLDKNSKDKFLYDLYFQYLANNFISSLYRKIVRGDEIYSRRLLACTPQRMIDEILSLWDDQVLECSINNKFKYVMDVRLKTNKTVVIILENMNEWREKTTPCLEWEYSGDIEASTFLFYLMAMNVVTHTCFSEESSTMNVKFASDERYAIVKFSNECDKIDSAIEDYIHIPPWLYDNKSSGDKPHLTLWSINHASNADSQILFEIKTANGQHQKKKRFEIIFKIPFKKKEKNL